MKLSSDHVILIALVLTANAMAFYTPLYGALSLSGWLALAAYLRWLDSRPKPEMPSLSLMRIELEELKSKVDKMILGGRQRGG